jgi:hypothetical protein
MTKEGLLLGRGRFERRISYTKEIAGNKSGTDGGDMIFSGSRSQVWGETPTRPEVCYTCHTDIVTWRDSRRKQHSHKCPHRKASKLRKIYLQIAEHNDLHLYKGMYIFRTGPLKPLIQELVNVAGAKQAIGLVVSVRLKEGDSHRVQFREFL